jgi:IS30 family transposase
MRYHQLTPEDRYTLAAYRKQVPRLSAAEIGRRMGRDRSTISRELRRNCCAHDGGYRAGRAQEQAHARRKRSRRNSHFGPEEWKLVEMLLKEKLSPEQISGRLRALGLFEISHETIYSYVWRDKKRGGTLYRYLRQPFKRRKRYGSYERRGRVTGKRYISERPTAVEDRSEIGHWEIDTVIGTPDGHCVASLVERVIGVVLIGKLRRRNVAALNKRVIEFIKEHPGLFLSITADNGTEFHGYREIEQATGVPIYFATPYHSWERGTNENTNGLIRQYLPKRTSMKHLTQAQCNTIAGSLNNRPRKRHGYRTPLEVLSQFFTLQ